MNIQQIAAHTDEIIGDAEKEHDILTAAVHSSFAPVTHLIQIIAQ